MKKIIIAIVSKSKRPRNFDEGPPDVDVGMRGCVGGPWGMGRRVGGPWGLGRRQGRMAEKDKISN